MSMHTRICVLADGEVDGAESSTRACSHRPTPPISITGVYAQNLTSGTSHCGLGTNVGGTVTGRVGTAVPSRSSYKFTP